MRRSVWVCLFIGLLPSQHVVWGPASPSPAPLGSLCCFLGWAQGAPVPTGVQICLQREVITGVRLAPALSPSSTILSISLHLVSTTCLAPLQPPGLPEIPLLG